jgi:eukaryotic-like serine/threonine-protein kinase
MSDQVRAELAALESSDRLEEAAELAERHALFGDAAALWERVCRFDRAARGALRAGDFDAALVLASRARDGELVSAVARAVSTDLQTARRAAQRAALSGHAGAAAAVYLAIGDAARAALEFEAGGLLVEAAAAHQRAGDVRAAARCLERRIAEAPADAAARLALGRLFAHARRGERALEHLQVIPASAPEYARALPLLHRLLLELDVGSGAAEVERELNRLGLEPEPAHLASTGATGEPEQLLFGRYRVNRVVATTPTARVYQALDVIENELVAVKLFAGAALLEVGRDALLRFEREALVLGQLSHRAIVPLHAYLPAGPAVVLRWMEGGSLAELLEHQTLSPARAVEITSAVLSALAEAHRRGILHRDIKPANVLFDATGAAHLADFGTAHVSDAAATVTAGVIGTLAYMAPEQRAGAPATIQSDVYGAGALLWPALTGGPPAEQRPFLSAELGAAQRSAASRLLASELERPADALAARAVLGALSWPRQAPDARPEPRAREIAQRPAAERVVAREAGRQFDRLLERELYVMFADPALLARALPFARADHPLLPAVLAYHTDRSELWVEYVAGPPLGRSLHPDERTALGEALRALHAAGGYHGRIDRDHVVERGGYPALRFPLSARRLTLEADLSDLERL